MKITKNTTLFVLLLISLSTSAFAGVRSSDDCRSLMHQFIAATTKAENMTLLSNHWKKSEKNKFISDVGRMGFGDEDLKIIIASLNLNNSNVTTKQAKDYLNFVLSLSIKDQKVALQDLAQIEAQEINSKFIIRFKTMEERISKKVNSAKLVGDSHLRYKELYYGCRALRPNAVNKNAAKDFKRFNFSLSLGTLAASYAFYNMDKEKNAEWFTRLGYDLGITVLFSYVGGKIQTNPNDTQIVKSIKSYMSGRVMGTTDIFLYDPLFNDERKRAQTKVQELKTSPELQAEINKLLVEYENRGLYRKLKNDLITTLKKLPEGISLGLKGESIDSNYVDWNNLTHEDLDRPEVQDVLVAAMMAQLYNASKGDWIDTGDIGVDRYVFNSAFYFTQIPKSIFQNYVTYKILCMGQDTPKLAFTKAVMFNVSVNFVMNQFLFGYREKAINQ